MATFETCVTTCLGNACSQERIAVEFDNDVIDNADNADNNRWYVKLRSKSGSDSASPTNDDASDSERSCASAVGKPAKLPPGILGPKNVRFECHGNRHDH